MYLIFETILMYNRLHYTICTGDLEHKRSVAEEKQILFSKEFKIPISQSVSARTGENVS